MFSMRIVTSIAALKNIYHAVRSAMAMVIRHLAFVSLSLVVKCAYMRQLFHLAKTGSVAKYISKSHLPRPPRNGCDDGIIRVLGNSNESSSDEKKKSSEKIGRN